ncbi:MAG: carbohydrate ABC transporter permease, partial [Firmicutes bacterium]|nr:carbohydrate ABC transporter permease [Bacillota bacterium]
MSSAVYHSKRKSEIAGRIIVYVLLIGLSIIFLLPFLWMLSTALKENAQLYQYPPKWIPSPPRWRNFIDAWSANAPFTLFLKNTL